MRIPCGVRASLLFAVVLTPFAATAAQVPNTSVPVASNANPTPTGTLIPGAGVVYMQKDPSSRSLLEAISVANMSYHGGPVQHAQKIFTIFWSPSGYSFPAGYQTAINRFVQDLNNSSYYGIAGQYYDGTGNISGLVSYGGTWLDTSNAFPHTALTYLDLVAEVNRAKVANG